MNERGNAENGKFEATSDYVSVVRYYYLVRRTTTG